MLPTAKLFAKTNELSEKLSGWEHPVALPTPRQTLPLSPALEPPGHALVVTVYPLPFAVVPRTISPAAPTPCSTTAGASTEPACPLKPISPMFSPLSPIIFNRTDEPLMIPFNEAWLKHV